MGQPTSTGEVRQFTLETERKYGLPEGTLFKQTGIESSFGKAMLSPKGAQGWFGFMPATAKEYGLADPNDFQQSADAAGRKMRDLLKKHDGNLDYALVDYNGGWKAVAALQAGKPWKESAGYLAKFHGMTADEIAKRTSAPPPLGEQFTSATTVSPTDGPSATALGYAQRQHDNEFGGVINGVRHLPDAIGLGFQTQNTVYNFWKDQGVATASGDFLDLNAPDAQDTLKQFPQNYWGYLMQSTTREGFDRRADRLRDSMQKEQELGNLGVGPALIGGIAGGLVDLPTVLAFVPGVGGAGFLTKASRFSNAIRIGLVGGVTNVAYDAVANQYRPTATASDLYISGAFGFGLGALSGGAASLRRVGALDHELERLRQWGMGEGKRGLRIPANVTDDSALS